MSGDILIFVLANHEWLLLGLALWVLACRAVIVYTRRSIG